MADFPATEGWSRWPAPAKLNLFLRITGRRADGYHTLQTVFRLLDWGDVVHMRPRRDGVIARVGAGAPLPSSAVSANISTGHSKRSPSSATQK